MSGPHPPVGVFRRLCLIGVVALAAIVVTGGAVRVTGSGLGCSTWPQCEPGSYTSAIDFHPLVEFGNRMVTVAVGALTGLIALGSLLLRPRRRDLVLLSWGLVLGYLAQAVLGGLTVLFKLSPLLVMGHFLVSMLLLVDVVVLHHRAGRELNRPATVVRPELRWLGRLLVITAGLALVLGTVVSGTGPHSGDEQTRRLTVLSLRSASQLHADVALILVGLTIATVFAVRMTQVPAPVRRRADLLVAIVVAQAVLGFSQYFLHLPSGLVLLHIAGATALWLAALAFLLGLTTAGPELVPDPVAHGAERVRATSASTLPALAGRPAQP